MDNANAILFRELKDAGIQIQVSFYLYITLFNENYLVIDKIEFT